MQIERPPPIWFVFFSSGWLFGLIFRRSSERKMRKFSICCANFNKIRSSLSANLIGAINNLDAMLPLSLASESCPSLACLAQHESSLSQIQQLANLVELNRTSRSSRISPLTLLLLVTFNLVDQLELDSQRELNFCKRV